ncbi:MAG: hypothetical protein R3F56_21710 [Planctomycetota bacterium]
MKPILRLCAAACAAPFFAATTDAQGFLCDFQPNTAEVVLNTDFAQVRSRNCPPVNVAGGIFYFRSVHIPQGVTVRGEGTNPMIFVVLGDFVVDGDLELDGGRGMRVDTLRSANFPAAGGIGVCGGGNGGRGSPNSTGTSLNGEPGYGPRQAVAAGGGGGFISCTVASNGRGSGGGGGSFATAGDPYYKLLNVGNSLVQQAGRGGLGGTGRNLPGGLAGGSILGDGVIDNDFFGLGYDLAGRRVVVGELAGLSGGAGGGGGGDQSPQCSGNVNWIADARGGGGGGGGGALVILAGGRIVVGPTGHIRCNGGDGGGGEQAGSNNEGGGGGGGSGGMISLLSYTYVELHAHGETYANNDYDFAMSADGGVGTQGAFAAFEIAGKYPPPPAGAFDQYGAGGFGGLGVIQISTLVDGLNADGTNTIFDDNVHVVRNGVRLTGAAKQRFLAWRGYLNAAGVGVDDHGVPTNVGANEGDVRPSPSLLPLFR